MRSDLRRRAAWPVALAVAAGLAGCHAKEAPHEAVKVATPPPALPTGLLVYSTRGQLVRQSRDGTPELLVGGPAWFGTLSPDGTQLAYWADAGEAMTLQILDLARRTGITVGRFTSLGSAGRNLNVHNAPCWSRSPDGAHLYFADGRQIWQVEPDGSNLQTVYEHAPGGCYAVSASPDGRKLAFVGVTESDQNLWIYSLDTRQAKAITDYTIKDGAVGSPAWCPNPKSERILYTLYQGEDVNVWFVSPEGGPSIMLTREGRTNSPAWDPTGKKIAVSTGSQNPLAWQIAIIDAEFGKFTGQQTKPETCPAGAYAPTITGAW